MKIAKRVEGGYNPYSQGRVELKKKKMKEGLDNKFSSEFYKKASAKRLKNKGINNQYEGEEEYEESEGQLLYEKQREYYLKMLGEEKVKNIEDLTNLEVQKKVNDEEQLDNNKPKDKDNININIEENVNEQNNIDENNEHNCPVKPLNEQIKEERKPVNPLKKKENPALLPPNFELVKNKENAFVCCVHHSQMPVTSQEKDPKNYQGMPPCMMASIIPAGKPSHIVAPLNIFESDNY